MSQKVNSTFFRLNLQNNWNSKYIKKTKEDISTYFFIDIMLKKYLIRFFNMFQLNLIYSKTFISKNFLKIFISFFITLKSIRFFKNTLKTSNKKKTNAFYKKKKKRSFFFFNKKIFLKNLPKKRLFIIRKKNHDYNIYKWKVKKKMLLNKFTNQLITIIRHYFYNKIDILLLFQKLNKGKSLRLNNSESLIFRKILIKLRLYSKYKFFKEIINILIIVLKKKKTAQLLVEFLAFQLSLLERHNTIIGFIKQSFSLFYNSKISVVKGLKFIIKGRINGVPRASIKGIEIGNLPRSSIEKNIKYYKSTSFTVNGCLGIKLWVYENN